MPAKRALTCHEARKQVGIKKNEKCCKRCHLSRHMFTFKIGKRHAELCCDAALSVLGARTHKKPNKKKAAVVEVQFDPNELEAALGV